MDTVMLPLVTPSTKIGDGLELLRRRERAGLVVQDQETYTLFYAGDLLRARATRIDQLRDMRGGKSVILLDPDSARTYELDLVRPYRTWTSYETMLTSFGLDYALAGESQDTAMVVTRHEDQTRTLLMSGGYKCTGTPPKDHYFPEPRVKVGDQCPLYPECTDPHGGAPIIEPA